MTTGPTTSTRSARTRTRTAARTWLMVLGWVLLATAILGLIPPVYEALHDLRFHIEGGEMALHWVLAIATLGVAYFVRDDALLSTIAIVFGVAYLGTAALGFATNEIGPWHVAIGDNLLHLALGIVTLAAGIVSRSRAGNVGRAGRSMA